MIYLFQMISIIAIAWGQVDPYSTLSGQDLELPERDYTFDPGARTTHIEAALVSIDMAAAAADNADLIMTQCQPTVPVACALAGMSFQDALNAVNIGNIADDRQLELTTNNPTSYKSSINALVTRAQTGINGLQTQGFSIASNGDVTGPDGTLYPAGNFATDQSMLLAGWQSSDITEARQILTSLNITATSTTNVASNSGGGSLGSAAGSNSSGVSSGTNGNNSVGSFTGAGNNQGSSSPGGFIVGRQPAPSPEFSQVGGRLTDGQINFRRPSSTGGSLDLDQLSINFRGTPIGVSNGNMFNAVNSAYRNAGLLRN